MRVAGTFAESIIVELGPKLHYFSIYLSASEKMQ